MKKRKIALTDKQNILQFFLNLYKVQSGTDMGEYLSMTIESFDPTSSYNLRVQKFDEWKSRRISISSLGDGSGSKSKCFKVIYDDVLVVKIPPVPIYDFNKYLECIDMERRIVDRLVPDIECIAPRVSTVLKRVPPFSDHADLPPDEFEKYCVERMKQSPALQDYLKIDGSFAFFMNLSKYTFLSGIIKKMHNEKEAFEREIMKQADLLTNPMMFEEKYGSENAELYYKINDVYVFYEKEMRRLAGSYGKDIPPIPSYKNKEWFLSFLAGKKIVENANTRFPPDFFKKTMLLLKAAYLKFGNTVEKYRLMIGEHVRTKIAGRNKTAAEGLVFNILNLIGDLKDKRVAIRDLKPDNVFVVGDWEANPLLLSSPENYSIGLIDFETAVSYDADDDSKIEQPLLAGTPSYATPSHLFENRLLQDIYEDLPRILFFQDWQAVTNMIFNIATGRHLVQKTGRVLPETMKTVQTVRQKGESIPDAYIKSSRTFWCRAIVEFDEKLQSNKKILKSIETAVPEKAKEILRQEILWRNENIRTEILGRIRSQQVFKSAATRRNLAESPPETITRYKNKWIRGIDVPKAPQKIKTEIVDFLKTLESLKLRKKYHERIMAMLNRETPKISVYDLLRVMFYIIHKTMYKHEWDTISDITDYRDTGEIPPDTTIEYERTIVYDKTIVP